MKFRIKRKKPHEFSRNSELPVSKELVPNAEYSKPVFSASELKMTPPRTAEDIRRAMSEGRFAEMTPDLAGE